MTCCSPIQTHPNDWWWSRKIPTPVLDKAARLALTVICFIRSEGEALRWFCGGLAAGASLGAYCKYKQLPSPALGGFGSVCGNGVAESIGGRQLNRLETRVLTIFLFWASTYAGHHGEVVTVGSLYSGYGYGLDFMDYVTGNKPAEIEKKSHQPNPSQTFNLQIPGGPSVDLKITKK